MNSHYTHWVNAPSPPVPSERVLERYGHGQVEVKEHGRGRRSREDPSTRSEDSIVQEGHHRRKQRRCWLGQTEEGATSRVIQATQVALEATRSELRFRSKDVMTITSLSYYQPLTLQVILLNESIFLPPLHLVVSFLSSFGTPSLYLAFFFS